MRRLLTYWVFLGACFWGVAAAQQTEPPASCAALPSLSLVPDNVDMMVAVGHPRAMLQDSGAPVAQGQSIAGVALASAPGNAESLLRVLPQLVSAVALVDVAQRANLWSVWAEPEAGKVIQGQALQECLRFQDALTQALGQAHLYPLYGVVTCYPGQEAELDAWLEQGLAEGAQREMPPGILREIVDIQGYRGVRLRQDSSVPPSGDPWAAALAQGLGQRSLYVLAKRVGLSLVLVICEDPAEIRLAASPEESLAARGVLAERGILEQPGLAWVAYASPVYLQAQAEADQASYRAWASSWAGVFQALASRFPEQEPVYAAAASGTAALLQQVLAVKPVSQGTAPLLAWGRREPGAPKQWEVQAEYDAAGHSFAEGMLHFQESCRQSADTVLYAESTPCQGGAWPDVPQTLDAVCALVRGVGATASPEVGLDLAEPMQLLDPLSQTLRNMVAGLGTVSQGLGGSTALVLDAAGQAPPTLDGQPGGDVPWPRAAYVSGVTNRGALEAGWRQMLAAAGQGLGAMGMDPALVGLLPVLPQPVGAAMSYSLALPGLGGDFLPQVLVSDSTWILGTSPGLNQELMSGSAAPGTPFSGCVFTFRPEPLARLLQTRAGATGAGSLGEAAEAAQRVSRVLEEVSGQCTIEDGRARWQFRIQFK